MAGQGGHFLHGRVLPDDDLVQRIPMSAHNLVGGLREHQITDLRACIDALKRLHAVGVPEPDALVSCSTACGQEPCLIRMPGDGLHCCLVIAELLDG